MAPKIFQNLRSGAFSKGSRKWPFMRAISLCALLVFVLSLVMLMTGKEENNKLEVPLSEAVLQTKESLQANDPQLISYLRNKFLQPPSKSPYNLTYDPYYGSPESHDMNDNLSKLRSLVQGKRNGFFIEAGAFDGLFSSNTLWLEQELNWTGLLIEPQPNSYQTLVSRNRKAWTSNSCLSSTPFSKLATFVYTTSNKRQNAIAAKSSTFELGIKYKANQMIQFIKGLNKAYFTCQCFPLYTFMLAMNRTTIDLLSLDLQGSEMEVLDTVPFDKVKIKVLVVENVDKMTDFNQAVVDAMTKRNYEFKYHRQWDYYFTLNMD